MKGEKGKDKKSEPKTPSKQSKAKESNHLKVETKGKGKEEVKESQPPLTPRDRFGYKDPRGRQLKKICRRALEKVKETMPDIIYDEIDLTHKELIDLKVKSLMD